MQRLLQVLTLAPLLHQSLGVRRAFGATRRHGWLGPSVDGLRGFTPSVRPEGQHHLVFLPLATHEITSPTSPPSRFGPSPAVPGSAYPLAAPFGFAVPHEPHRRHGLLRPLLTSATRSGPLRSPQSRPHGRGHVADLPR